jgi:hypothetical protein
MAGHNGAHRVAMVERKLPAIHLVGDQHFGLQRFLSGDATSIADRAGRNRLFARDPPIGAFQHDLASALVQARALQQGAQGHAGPFGIADRAQFPLGAFNRGHQKDPAVARALHGGYPPFGRQVSQFPIGEGKRTAHRAINGQPVGGGLQLRGREMAADVEPLGRGQEGIQLIEGHFQINRLLLPND